MRLPLKLMVLVFVIGLVGGVVGYALAQYTSEFVIKVSKPPAMIKTYVINVTAAPYQSIRAYGELASITQLSDKVNYTVTVRAENMVKWKVCVWIAYSPFSKPQSEKCLVKWQPTTYFVVDNHEVNGMFSIYANVYGKTSNTTAHIYVTITPKPLP